MQRHIKRGTTGSSALIFHIFALDSASTTGAGKASVAYSSWSCRFVRNGETISGAITPEDITTLGTYAAPTANTNIRIKAVDNTNMIGVYELHLHADWVNAANTCQSLTIFLTATGVAPVTLMIPLIAYDPQDATALGVSRIDAAITSRSTLTAVNVWSEAVPGAYTAGQAGKVIGDNVNATISSRSSHSAADVWASGTRTLTSFGTLVSDIWANATRTLTSFGTLASDVWAVGTRTLTSFGTLVADIWANATRTLSAFAFSVTVGTNNDKTGYALSTAGVNAVADQVWDEALVGHLGIGSTGEALDAAGAAGDPWLTSIPGAYGAGTAGYILGTNLNAPTTDAATPAEVLAQVNSALDAANSELTAVPATNGSLRQMIQLVFTTLRNRFSSNKSTGAMTLYKENSSTTLGTGTFTDDGTTVDRGKLS